MLKKLYKYRIFVALSEHYLTNKNNSPTIDFFIDILQIVNGYSENHSRSVVTHKIIVNSYAQYPIFFIIKYDSFKVFM